MASRNRLIWQTGLTYKTGAPDIRTSTTLVAGVFTRGCKTTQLGLWIQSRALFGSGIETGIGIAIGHTKTASSSSGSFAARHSLIKAFPTKAHSSKLPHMVPNKAESHRHFLSCITRSQSSTSKNFDLWPARLAFRNNLYSLAMSRQS